MADRILTIGEAATASGLTVKTIRYYEEIGLIPRVARTNGNGHGSGHRTYGEYDLGRLRFIRHARLFGLRLADIRELIAVAEAKGCPSQQPEYRKILQQHLRAIDDRVRHLLGLRTTIAGLMLRRPQTAQGCSWATCACMRQNESAQTSAASASRRRMKGARHV
jgi:MerR family gold-responsive transcriptional activator of gol and ges genes